MWISSIKHCQLLLIFHLYFFHLISLAFTPSSNSVKLCEFLPSSNFNYYWFSPSISFILFLLLLHLVVIVLNCVNFFHQALSIIIDFSLVFLHLISLAFTSSSNSVKLCEFLPSSNFSYYWFSPSISFILFLLLLHLVVIVLNCVNFFHQALSIIIGFSLVFLSSYFSCFSTK